MRTTTKTVLLMLAVVLAFAVANTYGTRNARGATGIPVPHFHGESVAARADMAREVVAQDWADLRSKQRRKACDLRGANGGTVRGFRVALRFLRAHSPSEGRHTAVYRRAMTERLENC